MVEAATNAVAGPSRQIPPNPNAEQDDPNLLHQTISNKISHQPSPGIIASSSSPHILRRRFLGPMPQHVAESKSTNTERKRIRDIRRSAVQRLRNRLEEGDDGDMKGYMGMSDGIGEQDGHRRRAMSAVRRIKVRRKGKRGEDIEDELDLLSDDEDDGGVSHKDRKGKGKQKGTSWVGESFDIGREFKPPSPASTSGTNTPMRTADKSSTDNLVDGDEVSQDKAAVQYSGATRRPAMSARSSADTADTFVTARTRFTSSTQQSSSSLPLNDDQNSSRDQPTAEHMPEGYNLRIDSPSSIVESVNSSSHKQNHRHSGTSSTQPLLSDSPKKTEALVQQGPNGTKPEPKYKKRLKSAMRKSSGTSSVSARPNHLDGDRKKLGKGKVDGGSDMAIRSKSVQFPAGNVHYIDSALSLEAGKGDKDPAEPGEVLSREGSQTEGTSAGAVEEAMADEESDEEDFVPGQVIMRDRMLVRVAYHRDEGLGMFDEATQRRNPCSRIERFEEYIVAWRKGRVELYQDWSNAVTARLRGGIKRLCFIIPLLPNRTSLSVFNEIDMTLCLTTSAGRLQSDLESNTRKTTTRSSTYKDRVAQSKQAKWLRTGRRGTHIFIMKVQHRSRAIDWYWELFRELGGELPPKFDINIPSFSSTVRLAIPQDDDMVGSKDTCVALSPEKVIDRSVDMVGKVIDIQILLDQRRREGNSRELDMELVWKSVQGHFQWISNKTTLENRQRNWAVLASISQVGVHRVSRTLQLRDAKHAPEVIRLEDGTKLVEPPGIEGYLIRHTSSSQPREEVYIATHDGNIVASNAKNAIPPLKPGKEGSTPHDVFPEVYDAFRKTEQRRMSRGIQRSGGTVDLRSINSIRLAQQLEENDTNTTHNATNVDRSHSREARSFIVDVEQGGEITLEAHSPEIAAEWVERLNTLIEYWKRRQRVDARMRMDAVAMHSKSDPFVGTELSNDSDNILGDIWNWCVIDGCRSITLCGRVHMRKTSMEKFRARFVVLTGGSLVVYKVKSKVSFHPKKSHFTLFGAYVYSGMLTEDDLHEEGDDPLGPRARVYQDGLQSSDGREDTTFCVRLAYGKSSWKRKTDPWSKDVGTDEEIQFVPPELTLKPTKLLIFRTRSKLERDRWVWAINAEMERQTRSHPRYEIMMREHGKLPI